MADTGDAISAIKAGTLHGLFRERLQRSPNAIAYRHFRASDSRWVDRSWEETEIQVRRWQAGLQGESLEPGMRVAVIAENGWDWVCFEQAALGLGLVVVPLFARDRGDNAAYILNNSGAALLVVENAETWMGLADHKEQLSALRRVVCLAEDPTEIDGRLNRLKEWLPAEPLAALITHESDQNDLATIVYTSGTTGRPKGVMLSHRNILSNVKAGLAAIPVYPEDRFLSFLPLSHMLERTVGYYVPMMAGAPVTFARSIRDLAEDLMTARPTVVISVPLVFERIYRQILERLDSMPGVVRWLFDRAVAIGYAEFEWRQGRHGWRPIFLLAPVVRATIGRKVVSELGGRLRIAISGGAALARRISRIFLGLGLDIVQGYGLTETSPIVSVNRREANDPASVGVPLDGVEVRIAGDGDAGGELEVNGPSVMLGYWKNEPATRDCMTEDGWFKTGDNVRIDGGHIYIVGRSKEVIVLSNGEKAPPDDMEKAISLDPWFTQAVVLGDDRPHLSAIVVLSQVAQKAGVSGADEASRDILLKRIDASLHDFPGYAKVKGVLVADEPWTPENGLLTSSLKKRRAQIFERYEEQINRLYE